MFDLHGQVAAVTGASAGLGRQFAMALARQGANLVLMSRRKEKQDAVAEEIIRQTGVEVLSLCCDVTIPSDVENAVNVAIERFGHVDILVNNAGRGYPSPLENYPLEGWRTVTAVDLDAVMMCTRDFGRHMLERGYGRIINISSVMGAGGLQEIHVAAYHACKGAVINFTRAAAAEWAERDVTVNCILPSFLPAELTITKLLSNLGFTGTFAVIIVILSLIGDGEGGKMFDFGLCLKSGIPYGMVVLVAAALQVSSKLTDASTGIPDMLSTLLMPITTLSSPFVSMAIVMVIGLALTNVINNIVSITIMVPIGMTLLQNIEYSPQVMVTLFSLELIQGLITPSSSMAGAMLHGNDEWISSKSVYKCGLILEGVVALCIAVVGIPIGPAIFSLFS